MVVGFFVSICSVLSGATLSLPKGRAVEAHVSGELSFDYEPRNERSVLRSGRKYPYFEESALWLPKQSRKRNK